MKIRAIPLERKVIIELTVEQARDFAESMMEAWPAPDLATLDAERLLEAAREIDPPRPHPDGRLEGTCDLSGVMIEGIGAHARQVHDPSFRRHIPCSSGCGYLIGVGDAIDEVRHRRHGEDE